MKLTKEQFEELQSEYEGVRLYSGRGMWGKECLAYEGDEEYFGEFVVQLAVVTNPEWADHMEDGEYLLDQMAAEMGKLFSTLNTDAMGFGGKVYYWRQIGVDKNE